MKSIIIKQTWYYLLYIFLLFFSPIYSLERIDLIKSCDLNNQCTQRLWQITDSFSEDFIKPDFNPTDWNPIEKFPVAVQSIYPKTQSMDFTLRTEFNILPDYLNEKETSGIYLDAIGDAYSIYINRKLVGKEGKVENGKVVLSRYGNRIKYPLNFSFFKEGKNVLVLHVQGNPKFNLTGLFRANGYYLDNYEKISYESRDRTGIILIFL